MGSETHNLRIKSQILHFVAPHSCELIFITHTRETVASAAGDWLFYYFFSLNMWPIRKLVQYGVMKGLLRRLHKYPIDLKRAGDSTSKIKSVSKYFDGAHSYDDICAKTGGWFLH